MKDYSQIKEGALIVNDKPVDILINATLDHNGTYFGWADRSDGGGGVSVNGLSTLEEAKTAAYRLAVRGYGNINVVEEF